MPRKPRKPIEGDDMRTIAPMNVEGMPWYLAPKVKSEKAAKESPGPAVTRKETFGLIANAMLAALVIAGIFLAVYAVAIVALVLWWG